MMTPDDIKLLLDPYATIRMILGKVRSCNRILNANGASKLISRDFRIGVRDGVLNFYSGRATYAMC